MSPTFIDKFAVIFASNLVGEDLLVDKLSTHCSSIEDSHSAQHDNTISSKPPSSFSFYWRSPPLHNSDSIKPIVVDARSENDPQQYDVLFIDVKINFLTTQDEETCNFQNIEQRGHTNCQPRTEVILGALINIPSYKQIGIQDKYTSNRDDYGLSKKAIGGSLYINSDVLTESHLLGYASAINIDFDATGPKGMADLLAAALTGCRSFTPVCTIDASNITRNLNPNPAIETSNEYTQQDKNVLTESFQNNPVCNITIQMNHKPPLGIGNFVICKEKIIDSKLFFCGWIGDTFTKHLAAQNNLLRQEGKVSSVNSNRKTEETSENCDVILVYEKWCKSVIDFGEYMKQNKRDGSVTLHLDQHNSNNHKRKQSDQSNDDKFVQTELLSTNNNQLDTKKEKNFSSAVLKHTMLDNGQTSMSKRRKNRGKLAIGKL